MTVREWFRLQRGELWRREFATRADQGTAYAIDRIATTILEGYTPWQGCGWIPVGPNLAMIEDVELYRRRLAAFEAVKADMDRAIARILYGRP